MSVPGEVAAWQALHDRFGAIPFADLLAPAIRYAEQGFPVPTRLARTFAGIAELLSRFSATADVYLRNGRTPREGDVLANSDLANSIRQVADGGADAFYRGPLAGQMVAGLNNAGGLFTEADFNNHYAEVGEPISTAYRGHRVYQTRPPSQGFLLLEMLNIVGGHDLTSMTPNSADAIHLLVEAKKIAYSDRNRLAGDPNFVDWPLDGLLSREYADLRRDQIQPLPGRRRGAPPHPRRRPRRHHLLLRRRRRRQQPSAGYTASPTDLGPAWWPAAPGSFSTTAPAAVSAWNPTTPM